MPKPRQRRPAGGAGMPLGIELAAWLWLIDEGPPIARPGDIWGLWTEFGDAATEFYARKNPGFRPSCWWKKYGFTGCAGPPQFAPRLVEGESELEWLDRNGCLFPGEKEAALASKAKRPARAQAYHEAHWHYVREAHAQGYTAVV
jgi:hypothetical protein